MANSARHFPAGTLSVRLGSHAQLPGCETLRRSSPDRTDHPQSLCATNERKVTM